MQLASSFNHPTLDLYPPFSYNFLVEDNNIKKTLTEIDESAKLNTGEI